MRQGKKKKVLILRKETLKDILWTSGHLLWSLWDPMPPALISSHHWAWTLYQLAFFRRPLGRNVTHGRFSIGDALAAARLITPMGRISCISEWSNLCSYWAIHSPCMATAVTEDWVLVERRCHASTCIVWRWGVTLPEDVCGQLPLMLDGFNCLSARPRNPQSVRSRVVIGRIASRFQIPTWTTYFQAQFCALLFHVDLVIISERLCVPSV